MKKFNLTTNTRIKFGRKLFQIKAAFSFGEVKEGALGGWVENENSLGDDVWIYEAAEVFKDAVIWGGEIWGGVIWGGVIWGGVIWGGVIRGGEIRGGVIKVTPTFIAGLQWLVTITKEHITIGCEHHLHAEWNKFDNKRIAEMSGKNALKFWKKYKKTILSFAKDQKAKKDEC